MINNHSEYINSNALEEESHDTDNNKTTINNEAEPTVPDTVDAPHQKQAGEGPIEGPGLACCFVRCVGGEDALPIFP